MEFTLEITILYDGIDFIYMRNYEQIIFKSFFREKNNSILFT